MGMGVICQQIAAWFTWIPACCLIYGMASPLQLPLFNVVLFFFSVVVGLLQGHVKEAESTSDEEDPAKKPAGAPAETTAKRIEEKEELEENAERHPVQVPSAATIV